MTTTPIYDEKDLLKKLREGDYMAFEVIYQKYNRPIAANLFRLLKSREIVEETLQDLFLKIWEQRDQIHIHQSLQAFLYRTASNLAHDYFRKAARDKKLAEHLWDNLMEAYDPFNGVCHEELDKALYKLIDDLPAQRKKVFVLCKLEGKSYIEVSKMLDISVAAVNDHITKANKFLKANYTKVSPLLALWVCNQIWENIK